MESLATRNLVRQGYEPYLPLMTRRIRLRGHRVRQVCPLFPRYVFLNLHLGEQDFGPVRSTKGVLGIVRFGERFAVVPDSVLNRLRMRADPLTGLYRLADNALRPQAAVRIKEGPFTGLEGIFVSESGEDRVVVLLNLLGQSTRVEISEALVEPMQRVATQII